MLEVKIAVVQEYKYLGCVVDEHLQQWRIQSGAWGAQAPPVMFSVAETC